jgi:hypothetical protein
VAILDDRREAWVAERGLFHLGLWSTAVEPVPLGWAPNAVAWSARRGLLALGVPGEARVVLWSPVTRSVVRDFPLPLE